MQEAKPPVLTPVKGKNLAAPAEPLDPDSFGSTLVFLNKVMERNERIRIWGAVFKVVKVRDGKVVLKCLRDKQ